MCGIVGFSTRQVRDQGEVILRRMMDKIRHRGPDADGTYIRNATFFGHLRLSIIDIDNGKQPMESEDGRFVLIFNGEIYNYLELRQMLVSLGYRLKTFSDTEVLLYMYVHFKEKALDYINGMFVFCILDTETDELFIARDHFGIKPLYYFEKEGEFIFASEVKALLAHDLISASVDDMSLEEYLTFQIVLGKHTLFKDINKLEPATYIKVRKGKIIEKHTYWQITYDIDTNTSQASFADEILLTLENSLSIQTRSDVPVGAYLSGGLDSSIVSVLADKNYFNQLKTFTGGFKESADFDETHHAKVVSEAINSLHHVIYPDHNDFRDTFEKIVYHMDEPTAGPGVFPQYMVSKLASEHVKVVLGGQGGDEIFGGYARYAVAYLEQCIKGAIFETQEEGQHVVTLHSIIEHMPMLQEYTPMIRNQFASGLFEEMDKRYYRLVDRSPQLSEVYEEDFLNGRDQHRVFNKFSEIFNASGTESYFNKMTYFDTKTLLPALLHVEDRMSMAVSLESRVPLLDKRLVELASRIPPTMKFAGGKTKAMLVKAVENVLPKQIVERKDKMGFPTPINQWLTGPLKDYVLDIMLSQKARSRGLVSPAKVEKAINAEGKFSRNMWGALNIELWYQKFIDG